jgi:hypothetical protein
LNTEEINALTIYEDLLDDELKSAFHALGLCAESGATAKAIARMLAIEPEAAHMLLMYLDELSLTRFNGDRAVMDPYIHEFARLCAGLQPQQAAEMIERHAYYFGIEIGCSYQKACSNYEDSLPALRQIDSERDNVALAQMRAIEPGFTNPRSI